MSDSLAIGESTADQQQQVIEAGAGAEELNALPTTKGASMNLIGIQLYVWWLTTTDDVHQRLAVARSDDRGEVTATTAMIVLLVVAAIAAGGIIAAKLVANAENVPSP